MKLTKPASLKGGWNLVNAGAGVRKTTALSRASGKANTLRVNTAPNKAQGVGRSGNPAPHKRNAP